MKRKKKRHTNNFKHVSTIFFSNSYNPHTGHNKLLFNRANLSVDYFNIMIDLLSNLRLKVMRVVCKTLI